MLFKHSNPGVQCSVQLFSGPIFDPIPYGYSIPNYHYFISVFQFSSLFLCIPLTCKTFGGVCNWSNVMVAFGGHIGPTF